MSGNQRQAFRFRFPANKQAGKLSLGDESIKVRLVDHSAFGFSLLAPIHRMITSDSALRLETTTAIYEVRIIHVEEDKDEYRVGVTLVREIADLRKSKASASNLTPTTSGPRRIRTRALSVTFGLLLATGVVISSLGGLHLFESSAETLDSKKLSSVETDSNPAADAPVARTSRTAKPLTAPRVNVELQQRVDQLGAAVFMMPEVAKKLELTPQQIKNMSRIVQKTSAAERQFASSPNDGKGNGTRSRDLLRQSMDEARNVLTDDQERHWAVLLGTD